MWPKDSHRTRNARPAQRARRHRHHRIARPVRAAKRRNQSRRRASAHVGSAPHQNARRNQPAQPLRHDGRCRLRRTLSRHEAGHEREPGRRPGEQRFSTTWARNTWKPSTQFRASAAIRIRTFFPIACCVPEIPSTTTFSTPTWAIARATTAASPSATPRTR